MSNLVLACLLTISRSIPTVAFDNTIQGNLKKTI
jgi:hypothetical protein